MFLILIAFVLTFIGVSILHRCWRQRQLARRSLQQLGGWILLVTAMAAWIAAQGPEFGVCFALINVTIMAWLLIAWHNRHPVAPTHEIPKPIQSLHWAKALRALPYQIMLTASVILLSGASAMFSTVVITQLLPWQNVNLIALGIYVMPIVWGVFAFYLCFSTRVWRPIAVITLIGAISAMLIYV